jgi:hypothetical protein
MPVDQKAKESLLALNGVFEDVVIVWQEGPLHVRYLNRRCSWQAVRKLGRLYRLISTQNLCFAQGTLASDGSLGFGEEAVPGVFGQRHVRPQGHLR